MSGLRNSHTRAGPHKSREKLWPAWDSLPFLGRIFLCPNVGPIPLLGPTLRCDNLGTSQLTLKNYLDHANISATRHVPVICTTILFEQLGPGVSSSPQCCQRGNNEIARCQEFSNKLYEFTLNTKHANLLTGADWTKIASDFIVLDNPQLGGLNNNNAIAPFIVHK